MTQTKLYKFGKDPVDNEINQVVKKETIGDLTHILSIPMDENNTDYQDYLEWVEAGNTAEAAD
jgi:hypothetical protein